MLQFHPLVLIRTHFSDCQKVDTFTKKSSTIQTPNTMVLGLRSKNKRPTSIQVHYTIYIQEIKPWPPSQSLKSLKSVVLQWENGDRTSGSTSPVAPSQSKIEFNEKFNLHATLLKESSGKGNGFQKNVLELSLYEPRRDRALKGQLLGTALVDLGEYGVVKDVVSIGVPLNCKRGYRNTVQPIVYVRIQLPDKEKSSSPSSSFRDNSLSKESVSGLMSGEYAEEEETEIASFTDDDVSSHSSFGNLASAVEANAEWGAQNSKEQQPDDHHENEPDAENENKMATNLSHETVPIEQDQEQTTTVPDTDGASIHQHKSLLRSLPTESSIDFKSLDDGDNSVSTLPLEKPNTPAAHSSPFSPISKYDQEKVVCSESKENVVDEPQKTAAFKNQFETPEPAVVDEPELITNDRILLESIDDSDSLEEKMEVFQNHSNEIASSAGSSPDNGSIVSRESLEQTPIVHHKYLQNALRKPVNSDLINSSRRLTGEMGRRSFSSDRLKNMQFTRSPPHSLGTSGGIKYTSNDQYVEDVKEVDMSPSITSNLSKVKHSFVPNNKEQELEARVEMLEAELREVASIEISLYSIVAEHGSSVHKVHTPARRLSRLYIHASKQWSRERKASAARSVVSGLVLVAKACGNDVPRLTFWLSNSIVLRTIITRAVGHSDISNNVTYYSATNCSRLMAKGKSSPLKWASYCHKKDALSFTRVFDDWENLSTFTAALERIESWIFSRIVESLWWQTLTPHMQSTNELRGEPKTSSFNKKSIGRKHSLGNKNNENFSIEIWKKAFCDACERLCPLRADGHECGCLPILAKLVMEQCIARLDIAMFNAILRESDDEMPTDPISDPISDLKVLPIPQGKLSFGAGAQLKNVIGNWSRWLTDLFGMDTDESPQGKNEQDDGRVDVVENFKSFSLLNALSDLLMLPKDLLLEKSVRKEVCPTFGASMIKQILYSFSPDEFCPDAIPDEVLEALDAEGPLESNTEEIGIYPYEASSISYYAPSAASVESVLGDAHGTSVLRRGGPSVARKCHTSDDELEELDSPLASIMLENSSSPPARLENERGPTSVRYQLLHGVWRSDD